MFQILNCSKKRKNSGFIFAEILIAIALFGFVFIALLSIGFSALKISAFVQKETQADFLVKEEFEAVRSYRDGTVWSSNGLGSVETGSPYHLLNNSSGWTLVSGIETLGIFTRQVVFDKVSRNPATQNIESVYNPSNDDSDTRKVTVTVAWPDKTYQVVSYFTNWK